jgi:seryl-tRNA(Sec) selenium transferase
MGIYEELGLKTLVNASDTYTRIGGSLMGREVLSAMQEAAESFVDLDEMSRIVCERIAQMTRNEAVFVSSGAAACVVLAASALMTIEEPEQKAFLPDATNCKKNEIILFQSQTRIPMLPYWKLISLSGAKVVLAPSTIEGFSRTITERTAGVFFFLGDPYEEGLPPIEEVIQAAHSGNARIVIDAAAQLPPKSNLWHYTRDLGADGIIFSGGKYLKGPQTTGLFLGSPEIAFHCRSMWIGRPCKVGKEEYAGLYAAVKRFVEADEKEVKAEQNRYLDRIGEGLGVCKNLLLKRVDLGRLNQDAPRLIVDLPEGNTGSECAAFLARACEPAIDVGFFQPDDPTGAGNEIFINSINLDEASLQPIVDGILAYLDKGRS